MNKENLKIACKEEINKLSMISQEKKIDLKIIFIEELIPIIDKYINLAYDYGSINNKQRITLNDMNFNG